MKRIVTLAGYFVCALLLLGGCGDNGYKLTGKEKAAFKDSTPEMRQLWENGLKADSANDYLTASTNFRSLLNQQITPEQLLAVQTALGNLNNRMNDAAAKGDVSAQKALDALKADGPRR
jgi:hypothetical protein